MQSENSDNTSRDEVQLHPTAREDPQPYREALVYVIMPSTTIVWLRIQNAATGIHSRQPTAVKNYFVSVNLAPPSPTPWRKNKRTKNEKYTKRK